MSGISIRQNISALIAQRELGQATSNLNKSLERLSSGLRINHASDDAAALTLADSLRADTVVYTQAVRNVNDGISMLGVAEGALQELSSIATRQRELATQAASGTLNLHQRTALNQEANALVDEFNRIVQTTSFNGIKLLDGTAAEVQIQCGNGAGNRIDLVLGQELVRTVGDGSFKDKTSFSTGAGPISLTAGDLNADGILDLVTADNSAGGVSVFLGNGDGSFQANVSYSTGLNICAVALGDLNGDGVLDIVSADWTDNKASVLIGNGDGSFQARISFSSGINPYAVALGDLNGDGMLDIVTADNGASEASVLLGNGEGSFSERSAYPTGLSPTSVSLGDLNGDGVLDLVTTDQTDSSVSVLVGNGDGTFQERISFSTGLTPKSVSLGDLNGDGLLDLVTGDNGSSTASVFIGNGDGTFGSRTSFATGANPSSVALGDLNGDGLLDVVTADWTDNEASVFMGNGDGSFSSRSSFTTGANPISIVLGDMNGDEVLDIVTADKNDDMVGVLLARTTEVTTVPYLNLCTRQDALSAFETIDATLERISAELGAIGAQQSRMYTAVSNIRSMRDNYLNARSQIMDADLAFEAAQMIKYQILQQAAAAVLAQASQEPALVLKLLG